MSLILQRLFEICYSNFHVNGSCNVFMKVTNGCQFLLNIITVLRFFILEKKYKEINYFYGINQSNYDFHRGNCHNFACFLTTNLIHVYYDEYGNFSVIILAFNSISYVSIIKFNVRLPTFNYSHKILFKSLVTLFCVLWH